MNLMLNESQIILRDTIGRYLSDNYDHQRRRAAQSDRGWPQQLLKAFADDLGILGVPFPPELGGLDCGPVDTMVVMEALGGALVPEPYLSTVVTAGTILKDVDTGTARNAISAIIDATAVIAVAFSQDGAAGDFSDVKAIARSNGDGYFLSGNNIVTRGGPCATHLLVGACMEVDGIYALFYVPADTPGLTRVNYSLIDGNRACDLALDNVAVPADALLASDAAPLIAKANDATRAAVCAESVGIMRRLLADTLEYTRQRVQFGKPLSEFQVLQHRMAAMHVEIELAASMALMVALELESAPRQRSKAAAAAMARVGRAGRFVAENAVQLHGAIGTTDELELGQYFKRIIAIDLLFGPPDRHVDRYVESCVDHPNRGLKRHVVPIEPTRN